MSQSVWGRASELARATPPERNRVVDFLRAASIIVVVLGHWLMAAPWVDERGAHIEHMLEHAPWMQWLTWGVQVMPIFFFVGGYANGISYDAAVRKGTPFRDWLAGRLERLLKPVLALVLFWSIANFAALWAGVHPAMVQVAAQIALVPTWFLAVYLMVILIVPIARHAWDRFGMASVWGTAALAALVDLAFFRFEMHAFGWTNYLFVWAAVHQLGLAWLAGRVSTKAGAAAWCVGGLAMLILLTESGPWPRSLVGVPGDEFSNTTPPHLPILALAAFQFGAVRLSEASLQRWLTGLTPWTATVLINGMIMTTFLWHSTVMMLLYGVGLLLGGFGLHGVPGTGEWWLAKLAWIIVFAIVLVPVVAAASRFERSVGGGRPAAVWRQVGGGVIVGVGLAALAKTGGIDIDGGTMRYVPYLLPFVGALTAGMIFRRPASA